jgi:hypothetical protein
MDKENHNFDYKLRCKQLICLHRRLHKGIIQNQIFTMPL